VCLCVFSVCLWVCVLCTFFRNKRNLLLFGMVFEGFVDTPSPKLLGQNAEKDSWPSRGLVSPSLFLGTRAKIQSFGAAADCAWGTEQGSASHFAARLLS